MSSRKNKLKKEIGRQLRYTSANSVMYGQAISYKAGIHPTDNECLDFLLLDGPLTAGQLSRKTGLTTGAITAVIDRLQAAGYVKRKVNKTDRRQVLVTPNVKKVFEEVAPHSMPLAKAVDNLIDNYKEKDLETILSFIREANNLVKVQIDKLREP